MTPDEWAARQKALDEAMPKMPLAVQAEMKAGLKNGGRDDESFPVAQRSRDFALWHKEKSLSSPGTPGAGS
jgi:hypothetical protein